MSDTPVETPVEGAVEAVAEPTEVPDSETPDEGPVSRQAAKWRARTRELEAELAVASDTITGLRRERAEALAAEQGLKPEALWATTDLEILLGESGTVDPEKVVEAVEQAVEKLNVRLQPKRGGLHVPDEGRSPGLPLDSSGKAKWEQAFKPTYHRNG